MKDQAQLLRRVSWREICPWLLILRSFRISTEVRMLLLATVGVWLTPVGWLLSEWMIRPPLFAEAPEAEVTSDALPPASRWPGAVPSDSPLDRLSAFWGSARSFALTPVRQAVGSYLEGWRYVLRPPPTLQEVGYLLVGTLWTFLIWALVAGGLMRLAVVRLAREQRLGLFAAVGHVCRKYLSYIGAPLLPAAAILFGLIVLAGCGLCMRTSFGFALAVLLWPLVLIGSVVLVILIVGVAVGWPLMWTALGAEVDADSWDAMSRGYAYALQNPLRLLWYVGVAVFQGVLGWLVVFHFVELTLAVSQGAILWGAGVSAEAWRSALFEASAATGDISWLAWVVRGWNGLLRTVGVAYGYSFFFTAASAIYLLLRLDTNQTLLDEVFVSNDDDALRLPPLPPQPAT